MDPLAFKPLVPGVKTLWVLKFKRSSPENTENTEEERPAVDFFIPSPFGKNEWVQNKPENTAIAQAMLKRIQDACREMKEHCQDTEKLKSAQEYLDKTEAVFKDLQSLDEMIRAFDEFMKRFYPPPSKEENTNL